MTLNPTERRRTSEELKRNLAVSGLTRAEAAVDLQFTPERLQSALDVADTADPVDIGQLRDYLEQAVRDGGRTPVGYSVLTSRSRLLARVWFRLRDAPRHAFAAP